LIFLLSLLILIILYLLFIPPFSASVMFINYIVLFKEIAFGCIDFYWF
jgi:hypothetical protein